MRGQPKNPSVVKKYTRLGSRAVLHAMRWGFLAIGTVTASSVLFIYLFRVNESIYDPSLFAIGVSGLFAAACSAILLLISSNRRLRLELKRGEVRNEKLADKNWELQEAEERAKSLLETQGDLIVRRDAAGRITYANDAFCVLAGQPHASLLGSARTLNVLAQTQLFLPYLARPPAASMTLLDAWARRSQ